MSRKLGQKLLTAKIAKQGRRGIVVRITQFFVCGFLLFLTLTGSLQAQTTIRVGAFPNITHAQPMIGKANGDFEKAMGPSVKIQWTSFNAGPSAIHRPQPFDQHVHPVRRPVGADRRRRRDGRRRTRRPRRHRQRGRPEGNDARDPSIGKHAGCRIAGLAEGARYEVNGQGWGCAGGSTRQSGSANTFLEERTRCGVGAGTMGDAPDPRR